MHRYFRLVNWRRNVWVCPNCGCEIPYDGEGSKRCPNPQCGAWMQEE